MSITKGQETAQVPESAKVIDSATGYEVNPGWVEGLGMPKFVVKGVSPGPVDDKHDPGWLAPCLA